jgi:hypothetical protein
MSRPFSVSDGTVKKLSCLLLVALILFGFCLFVGKAHASTPVGGLLGSDTTWDATHSPYQLTGDLGVETGVTLTINPGVTVDLAGNYIDVNGTLNAVGTSSNGITFTTSVTSNTQGSQSYYPTTPQYQAIQFETGSSGTIEYANFNIASLFVCGGSPIISSSTFNHPFTTAIDIMGGSPAILNNTVNSGSTGQNGIVAHSNPTVSNNVVNGGCYGIYAQGSAYVSNNIVVGGGISVSLDWQASFVGNTVIDGTGILCSTSGLVQQNYIYNNSCGISGSGTFQDNTIVGNKVGISLTGPATITGNNIHDNSQGNIILTTDDNVDATNNWWGTTETQAINQTIHDFKNNFNLGVVTFTPFLTQPNSAAPSAPRTTIDSPLISTSPAPTAENSTTPAETTQPTPLSTPTEFPTQNPTEPPPPPLNQITNPISGSNLTHFAAVVALIVVALVASVLIIVVIRKRTLNQTAPARRAKKQPSKRGRRQASFTSLLLFLTLFTLVLYPLRRPPQ